MRAYYGDDVVLEKDQLKKVVEDYLRFPAFAFDVETRGLHSLDPRRNEVFWISLAGPGRADVIPLQHSLGEMLEPERKEKEPWYDHANPTKTGKPRKKWRTVTIPARFTDPPEQMWPGDAFDILRPLLFSPEITKIGHNLKFDLQSVAKYYGGELPPPPYHCTQIATHILNENIRDKSLDGLVKLLFEFEYEQLGKTIEHEPFSKAALYSYLDSKYDWLLYRRQKRTLDRWGNAFKLDMDLLEAICAMEMEGVPVDLEQLDELDESLAAQMRVLKAKLWKEAGREWNLNSVDQKAWFVYEHRGNHVKHWTQGGKTPETRKTHPPKPSTDERALEPIAKGDVHIARLLEYANLAKLHGTYVEGIRKWLNNGRVHGNFTQDVARTGRLTCKQPNLQNIPKPGHKNSTMIRGLFVAPSPEHKLIVADYSQVEPRILAHFTGEKLLIQTFQEDGDPYLAMGAQVYRCRPEDITPQQRDVMKVLVLSIMYGAGAETVAGQAGIPISESKRVLKEHRRSSPVTYRWMANLVRNARNADPPHVETLLGRWRRLPHLRSPVDDLRAEAERQAVNSVIQGTAGELIKLAMIRLHRTLPEDMRMILTVHDEIATIAPADRAQECVELVEHAMVGEGIKELLNVPLKAEAKIVDDWSQAKG